MRVRPHIIVGGHLYSQARLLVIVLPGVTGDVFGLCLFHRQRDAGYNLGQQATIRFAASRHSDCVATSAIRTRLAPGLPEEVGLER